MASNVRFVDNLKVGAYAVQTGASPTVDIDPNINNYVLTATGTNTIAGEEQLQFDGLNLGIGGASAGARFEINDITGNDLLLIKNASNQGIKIDRWEHLLNHIYNKQLIKQTNINGNLEKTRSIRIGYFTIKQ